MSTEDTQELTSADVGGAAAAVEVPKAPTKADYVRELADSVRKQKAWARAKAQTVVSKLEEAGGVASDDLKAALDELDEAIGDRVIPPAAEGQ